MVTSLGKNDTTLVAFTPEEFLDYAVAVKVSQGTSCADDMAWLESAVVASGTLTDASKLAWEASKEHLKFYGSFSPVALDAQKLRILAIDLHRGGNVFSKYRISTYLGRSYVVIEGYPRLREHLTAARYLAKNPKVVNVGIGKLGVKDTVRGGFVVSIIFSVAFHAIDQLLYDKATWHRFVAGVTVDVVSAATGGAIAWGLVAGYAGGTAAMAAIGPILFVIGIGVGATIAFSLIDKRFELTNKLAKALIEAEKRVDANIYELKREVRLGLNFAEEDPVGFMHKLLGVPYFKGLSFE